MQARGCRLSAAPAVRLLALLFVIGGVFALPLGCDTMSVGRARDMALQFQDAAKGAPPRGLGEEIGWLVKRYGTNRPERADFCNKPSERLTDEQVHGLAAQYTGRAWIIREKAFDEFFKGNISAAVRLIEQYPRASSNPYHKTEGYAVKAWFLAESGDYKAAERAMDEAEVYYGSMMTKRGQHADYWKNRYSINFTLGLAAIHFARGDMVRSEKELYKTLHHVQWEYKTPEPPGYQARGRSVKREDAEAKRNLARALMWQGRLVEAEVWAREAVAVRATQVLPQCLITLGEVFFEQGRYGHARDVARTALYLMLDECYPADAYFRAYARQVWGKSLLALGDWPGALKQFETIAREMATDPVVYENRFQASVDCGVALMMTGHYKDALARFDLALARTRERLGADHYAVAEVQALSALALALGGDRAEAFRRFNAAVPTMLEKWRQQDGESISRRDRGYRFHLIVSRYIRLLTESGEAGNIARAFGLADTLKSRAVGRALASSAVRAASGDPGLAELIRQRQDLEMQLAAHESRLAAVIGSRGIGVDPTVIEELRASIADLRRAAEILDREVKSRFSDYESMVNPYVRDVAAVRAVMEDHEALVSVYTGPDNTYVWAFGKTGPVAFAQVAAGQKELAGLVEKLRRALAPGNVTRLSDIPDFDAALAYGLYQKVLGPVEAGWKPSRTLLFSANGPLDRLPPSVLLTGPASLGGDGGEPFSDHRALPWLARTHAIAVLPSACSLVSLRNVGSRNDPPKMFAGFGDPWFGPAGSVQTAKAAATRGAGLFRAAPNTRGVDSARLAMLPRLPETADEVRAIARALGADPEKDVFLGPDASEDKVKTMKLNDRKVLVFATHGLAPGDLDGLHQPALALCSPQVTGEKNSDGLLTMGEVMGLKLNANWVVLSACDTAAAEVEGAEAVSGLGQAFFYAGAKSLLVTSWPVETNSARDLTTGLFENVAADPGQPRAEALRKTMIHMIDHGRGPGFSYAHPIFWAPFVLVGDGQ